MVTFLFSVHIITEAKQYAGLGRAVDLPATGTPWCSTATAGVALCVQPTKSISCILSLKSKSRSP